MEEREWRNREREEHREEERRVPVCTQKKSKKKCVEESRQCKSVVCRIQRRERGLKGGVSPRECIRENRVQVRRQEKRERVGKRGTLDPTGREERERGKRRER